jgi:hypothetical protein
MDVIESEVLPPTVYNERQIQKDLVRLSAKGYSVVPYQKRIKSKIYYRFYKKRIDAFCELVQAEAEVWQAMREWKTEIAKLRMVDKDIEILKREKDVKNLELEIKQLELQKKRQSLASRLDDDEELSGIRRREEIVKAQLRLAKLEGQLESANQPKESSVRQEVSERIEAMQGVAEILNVKKQLEKNMKKQFAAQGFSESEINDIIDDFDRIAKEERIL